MYAVRDAGTGIGTESGRGMKIDKRRRPYLDGNEYELFEQCSKRRESKESELKRSYQRRTDGDKRYFRTYTHLTVSDLCQWLSNDDFPCIASEGVAWLMHFISLGARTAEYHEKVEFVELELRAIVEYHCMEDMKDRINPESYGLMEKDLEAAKTFYEIH